MHITDSQLLPISALQHLLFCERQCALIHLEQLWAENWRTVAGQHLHQKAHEGPDETREGVRIVRGLNLTSRRLRLVGKADIVEFAPPPGQASQVAALTKILEVVHSRYVAATGWQPTASPVGPEATRSSSDASQASGAATESKSPPLAEAKNAPLAAWSITPVEYKRGKPKSNDCDRVQLCAQAICLEEMLNVEIGHGYLFYGERRRRQEIVFDITLRRTTEDTTSRLHAMIDSRITPKAKRDKKCDSCSLVDLCLPGATNPTRSASRFASRQFAACLESEGPASDFSDQP